MFRQCQIKNFSQLHWIICVWSLFPKFALQKGKISGADAPYLRVGFQISKSHTCIQKSGKNPCSPPPPLRGVRWCTSRFCMFVINFFLTVDNAVLAVCVCHILTQCEGGAQCSLVSVGVCVCLCASRGVGQMGWLSGLWCWTGLNGWLWWILGSWVWILPRSVTVHPSCPVWAGTLVALYKCEGLFVIE